MEVQFLVAASTFVIVFKIHSQTSMTHSCIKKRVERLSMNNKILSAVAKTSAAMTKFTLPAFYASDRNKSATILNLISKNRLSIIYAIHSRTKHTMYVSITNTFATSKKNLKKADDERSASLLKTLFLMSWV